jgi:hypothetical protein
VVGVAKREGQVVCCGLGVEKENIPKVMQFVCVDGYGWRGEKWIRYTYTFVRSGMGAVSGVGSSGGMCSGISEWRLCVARLM